MGLRPLSITTVADMDTEANKAGPSTVNVTQQIAAVRFELVPITDELAQNAIAAYFDELNDRFEGGFEPSSGGADHDAVLMSPPRLGTTCLGAGEFNTRATGSLRSNGCGSSQPDAARGWVVDCSVTSSRQPHHSGTTGWCSIPIECSPRPFPCTSAPATDP
jgi:hypothetical protein